MYNKYFVELLNEKKIKQHELHLLTWLPSSE